MPLFGGFVAIAVPADCNVQLILTPAWLRIGKFFSSSPCFYTPPSLTGKAENEDMVVAHLSLAPGLGSDFQHILLGDTRLVIK